MKSIVLLATILGITAAAPAATSIEKRGTGTTATELESGACRKITFIFARGSGEFGNLVRHIMPMQDNRELTRNRVKQSDHWSATDSKVYTDPATSPVRVSVPRTRQVFWTISSLRALPMQQSARRHGFLHWPARNAPKQAYWLVDTGTDKC